MARARRFPTTGPEVGWDCVSWLALIDWGGQEGSLLLVYYIFAHILKLMSHVGEGASQARWATCDLQTQNRISRFQDELSLWRYAFCASCRVIDTSGSCWTILSPSSHVHNTWKQVTKPIGVLTSPYHVPGRARIR